MYAGVICKKCGAGCNHDIKIRFLDNLYKRQEKRYVGYICSSCITEIAGGEKEIQKLQSLQILSEMGL